MHEILYEMSNIVLCTQITAETGFSGAGSRAHAHLPSNERVEFQMHGQKGPHSYKFGYDTGKGYVTHDTVALHKALMSNRVKKEGFCNR